MPRVVSFKPEIKRMFSMFQGDRYFATIPVELHQKTWSILHGIQNKIVNIKDEGPTQISVQSNQGYDEKEALCVLAVAVYITQNNQSFETLMRLDTYSKHLQAMHESITFPDGVLARDIEPYLAKFIISKVGDLVQKHIDHIHLDVPGLDWQELTRSVKDAKAYYKNITAFSQGLWFKPYQEKKQKLADCEKVLELIDLGQKKAQEAAQEISKIESQLYPVHMDFLTELSNSPLTILPELVKILTSLAEAQAKAQKIVDDFDKERLMPILDFMKK